MVNAVEHVRHLHNVSVDTSATTSTSFDWESGQVTFAGGIAHRGERNDRLSLSSHAEVVFGHAGAFLDSFGSNRLYRRESSTVLDMRRSPPAPLVSRLERIRDLSDDLSRELTRRQGDMTASVRTMVDTIKRDADAVHRALRLKR
jgi:hypothetical protein